MHVEIIAMYLWAAWAVSWLAAAVWADRAAARPPVRAELTYRILNGVGFLLVIGLIAQPLAGEGYVHPRLLNIGWLGRGLWVTPPTVEWALVAVEIAGFAFCWWARLHLGRLWSGSVTRKAGHRVVDTGPYRWVRHPIYTGLLLAALATTLIKGSPVAVFGFAVLAYSLHLKARLEERFLRAGLGEAAYDGYAARTPMLIPGLRPAAP